MSWTVHAQAPLQVVGQDPEALCIEIDPRSQIIRLGLQPLGATSQEADCGAVLQRHLEGSSADWGPIIEWLMSEEAEPHLSAIEEGYRAEQGWSGDWQAEWSPTAWGAATALHRAVTALLSSRASP
jgi:hypothetical protein